jgi:hypothetical protein
VTVFLAALLIGWLIGFIPNRLLSFDPPDWVPMSALVFPTFSAQIQQGLGLIWSAIRTAGPVVADWIGGLG